MHSVHPAAAGGASATAAPAPRAPPAPFSALPAQAPALAPAPAGAPRGANGLLVYKTPEIPFISVTNVCTRSCLQCFRNDYLFDMNTFFLQFPIYHKLCCSFLHNKIRVLFNLFSLTSVIYGDGFILHLQLASQLASPCNSKLICCCCSLMRL